MEPRDRLRELIEEFYELISLYGVDGLETYDICILIEELEAELTRRGE